MVESGLNPNARGSKGEVGLFQLLPKHAPRSNTIQSNIKAGLRELKYWQKHCPTTEDYTFVNCYNQGNRKPKYPKLFPYYIKVMKSMNHG